MSKEALFQRAAGELAGELAIIHATLFNLIAGLLCTDLSPRQRALVDAAYQELRKSQRKFFAQYADEVGGVAPERN